MTDNDIIKALECCVVSDDSCSDSCPLRHIEGNCFYILNKPILDLINRQKAEIERLQNDLAKEFVCFVGSPHKVENCPFFEELENERAEAIKEFAKKVKEEIAVWHFDFTYYSDILEACQRVDNIAKRMVGESK